MSPKIGDVVYVSWVDSYAVYGWEPPARISPDAAAHCESAGFLIRNDASGVQVACSRHVAGSDDLNQVMSIPRAAVKQLYALARVEWPIPP